MEWFRFYTETIHDRKIRRLPPAQRWLWVTVLTMASQSPRPGYLLLSDDERNVTETFHETACNVAVTNEDLADLASIDLQDVTNGLEMFRKQQMIRFEGDVIIVTNFKKRQYISDSSTDRVRKHREKVKRYGNVSETAPDTETDTETDKERMKSIASIISKHCPYGISKKAEHDIFNYMDKLIDLELLDIAFQITSQNNPRDKGLYAAGIVRGFLNDGVTTIAQYQAIETQRQVAAGGVRVELSASSGTGKDDGRQSKKSITGTAGIVGRVPPREA